MLPPVSFNEFEQKGQSENFTYTAYNSSTNQPYLPNIMGAGKSDGMSNASSGKIGIEIGASGDPNYIKKAQGNTYTGPVNNFVQGI